MANPAAIILDCTGPTLEPEEKRFFAELNPYGFILFARHCVSPEQIQALVADLRAAVGRHAPVLIDQEGGRVARLRPPQWRASPAAGSMAALGADAAEAIYTNSRLMAAELLGLGIDVDCAPVADLPVPGAHGIIGDRAYGDSPEPIVRLAAECARGLMDGGVCPILKHIPGHGRATADSHEALPTVDTPLEVLRQTDFVPFRALAPSIPMAMTAHVLYSAIDPARMATVSPTVIRLIREELGFDGLLMSDDLSMKAMTGNLTERASAALAAGCDIALHCNGTLEERRASAAGVSPMTDAAWARHERAFAQVRAAAEKAKAFDIAAAEARLSALLRSAA